MKNKKSAVVLVFNSKGKLALQLRSASDESYPSHWDFSAAGKIQKDEEPEFAAERELREELGINATVQYIDTKTYSESDVTDECYFYKAFHNGPFAPDHQEVEKARFFSLEEIQIMIDRGEKFHPEFPYFWDQEFIQYAYTS